MSEHWTARHGKPIIFVILTLVAVGVYLATTIPVAVFPEVDFPGAQGRNRVDDVQVVTLRQPQTRELCLGELFPQRLG